MTFDATARLIESGDSGELASMSFAITSIVLLAAVLHASWNALLRAGADRLWSITVMCIAIALACAALAPFVPMPARASWGYALASALLHIGYNLFLGGPTAAATLDRLTPFHAGPRRCWCHWVPRSSPVSCRT
jgi:hypothetical protein